MGKLTDEKFVSVEYDTWNNKYVPMEAELNKLRQELEEEKANKLHTVVLEIRDRAFSFFIRSAYRSSHDYFENKAKIATLEPQENRFPSEFDYSPIHNAIKHVISRMELEGNMIFSVERAKEEQAKFHKSVQELETQLEKARKLPKFTRWLLKIKL